MYDVRFMRCFAVGSRGLLYLQVLVMETSGDLLDAQKLLLTAGTAMQDVEMVFHVSRAMQSAAQELRCLQVGICDNRWVSASRGSTKLHDL